MPGTGFAVGNCVWVDAVWVGLAEGFAFSVIVVGEEGGLGLGLEVDRGGWVLDGLTVRPGDVTESEEAVVVVVVVVVWLSLSRWRRT